MPRILLVHVSLAPKMQAYRTALQHAKNSLSSTLEKLGGFQIIHYKFWFGFSLVKEQNSKNKM